MAKEKLIIVGLGMAACRLLDELVKAHAQDRYDITVFGDESVGGYNRILLSHVLSGEQSLSEIISHDHAWFEQQGMHWFSGRKVVRLDAVSQQVVDSEGDLHDYDRLVLATGSVPIRAAVAGNQLTGVMSFRDVLDVQKLLSFKANKGPVVVVGAGLLGLEAAYGLIKRGLDVLVVHRSDRIMSQQLDHAAAAILQSQLEALGIRFLLSTQVTEIIGKRNVEAVQLSNGETHETQAVVMAMGIRPNVQLAQSNGLAVNRGVMVDARLKTSATGVYALGECCEFDGATYGLVAPIYRQVSVLVNHLCGDEGQAFYNEEVATQLKVSGISMSSFGDPLAKASQQVLVYEDVTSGVYRKIMLDEDNRVAAAVLLGNIQASQPLFQHYQRSIPLSSEDRAAAVFGQLASVSEGV